MTPYLVDTLVPSTSGSRSRCTPWRDTSALPESLRDENMKETMGGFNAWLREKAPILEPFMGNAYPKADPAAVQRAGAPAARGPVTIHNEIASVSVTAPGADPASISGATARGVNEGIRRGVEDTDRYFITGVEAAR
ncbi:hypothetical protein D9M69_529220 [compost metagenome]